MSLQKNKPGETRALVPKVIRNAQTRKVAARTPETSRRGKGAQHGHGEIDPVSQEGQRHPPYKKGSEHTAFTFVPCVLMGPDGKTRPGWEMRVGDMMFGRADSQETLRAYYARLHDPLPSGHWRERSWGPQKRKPAGVHALVDHEDSGEHADHPETDFDLDTLIADDGKE